MSSYAGGGTSGRLEFGSPMWVRANSLILSLGTSPKSSVPSPATSPEGFSGSGEGGFEVFFFRQH